MAIGGEARHIFNGDYEGDIPESIRPMDRHYARVDYLRTASWKMWMALRAEKPAETMKYLEGFMQCFNSEGWGDGVGGPGWGTATKILLAYYRKHISHREFL